MVELNERQSIAISLKYPGPIKSNGLAAIAKKLIAKELSVCGAADSVLRFGAAGIGRRRKNSEGGREIVQIRAGSHAVAVYHIVMAFRFVQAAMQLRYKRQRNSKRADSMRGIFAKMM